MSIEEPGKKEVPLTNLKDGESGIVVSVKSGYGRAWGLKKRLMDMGITPGTKITVVKTAPFHGPLEVIVRGYRLAIGRGMAEKIFVKVERVE
ncbi:MAG: ferrous iron transport protein A [Candidatus Brockarchaeota archaeon]|nr:ferrous iron transport protein A [Candidatus Brockarchaeota archaeon]